MGGVAVDAHGRSSIKGLWAGGEVSSTGAHGANRLASNSLLEAVVYAARIADDIAGSALPAPARLLQDLPASRNVASPALSETDLRKMMTSHVGVIRDGDRLAEAVRAFARLERGAASVSLRNMATSALLVAASAWARRESRGAHDRSDYPAEMPALAHRTMTTLAKARAIAEQLTDEAPARDAQPKTTPQTAGEEVRNPQKALPRAIMGALVVVVSVYVLVALAGVGSQPVEDFEDPEQQSAGLSVILEKRWFATAVPVAG